MDAPTPEPARRGRKRDPSRDPELLDAALDVLAESGYAGMTVDMVAARAKAGKATVYRRWATKSDLVLEAVTRLDGEALAIERLPDTGTLRGDIHGLLEPASNVANQRRLRIMTGLTSMLSDDERLAEAAVAAVVEPWIRANRIMLRRAIDRGEIGEGVDVETLAQVIPSMATYRVCIERKPIERQYIEAIIDGVLLPAVGLPPGA